jgi:hypothetical protein
MDDIKYYDIKTEPFKIYGIYYSIEEGHYRRIPSSVADMTNDGVQHLSTHTAGGRVRFKTNSEKLVLKVENFDVGQYFHQTPLMQYGFDIYQLTDRGYNFLGTTKPPFEDRTSYEFEFNIPNGDNELTIVFPPYGCVKSLEIGICEGASLEAHRAYKYETPVVYYGSSITQGGCASRPGKTYQDIICRRFDYNYINLGFSGSAKGEDAICEHMATLDMSAFVSDYDHNSSTEQLRQNHFKLYSIIRSKHPNIPYLMVTKPDFKYTDDDFERRSIIMESYIKARRNGDKNVYFVDGSNFFIGYESFLDMTVDACHPTDDGFRRMADNIGTVMDKVFPWKYMK